MEGGDLGFLIFTKPQLEQQSSPKEFNEEYDVCTMWLEAFEGVCLFVCLFLVCKLCLMNVAYSYLYANVYIHKLFRRTVWVGLFFFLSLTSVRHGFTKCICIAYTAEM